MRIVFAGSPSFAVPSLESLLATRHEIAGVITQPDRPAGRGRTLKPPPVKQSALQHSLKVFQPEKFNTKTFLGTLEALEPDVIIVVAYGKIFRRRSLALPRLGCVNLHASLLPKYRGVAPINWAIIDGETETGVTTFFMDEGIDTGDIILSRRTAIADDETAGDVLDRLALIGADLLVETCDLLDRAVASRIKQDDQQASYAPKFRKEDGEVMWDRPGKAVYNHMRGVTPWPGAFTFFKGQRVKVVKFGFSESGGGRPGEVIEIDSRRGILVSCGDAGVWLRMLQAEGRKPVGGSDFARGYRVEGGEVFGSKNE
jgi:methionyl-tRNA formyltransferase